jgi:hypothetical protein
MEYLVLALVIVAAGVLIFESIRALRIYLKFRGKRLVSCPETHQPAAVSVAAGKAALNAAIGTGQIGLSACSRWPEKKDCGQDCLSQVQDAPDACLVWNIANHWYEGKNCAYCHKPFGEIRWHDHTPALVDSERKTVQWNAIPAEKLPEVLSTHLPVCWNCHTAESFRRIYPDLVVDRPESRLRMRILG